ncbi:NADAR family protein, partial [Streptococcus pneumoniae]|uniref:NADAR family protein n=1 Tax=Streptococcus pneumoniae TaxID=1313 RepID=UPI0012D80558
YQACKFTDKRLALDIARERSPKIAAAIGRTPHISFRGGWEEVKLVYMMDVLHLKFGQNGKLRDMLLKTGDHILVEHTRRDSYWG